MKRAMMMLAGVLAAGTIGWTADVKTSQDLSAQIDQLTLKLEHTARRADQPNSGGSSVVGLRGSKQEPLSKQLYWKGKAGNAPVTPDEVKMFRTAIEEAKAGQKDKASSTLKSFVEKYPKSSLKGDAEDTLKLLAGSDGSVAKTSELP